MKPWTPLTKCLIGKSYSPRFYDFIDNVSVRQAFQRIAEETEEDYNSLIAVLHRFNVRTYRPQVSDDSSLYLLPHGGILAPPMKVDRVSTMLGNTFYLNANKLSSMWSLLKGPSWPLKYEITDAVIKDCSDIFNFAPVEFSDYTYKDIPAVLNKNIVTRIVELDNTAYVMGDIPFTDSNYIYHKIDIPGNSSFYPVAPGLIICQYGQTMLQSLFPDWEIVYVPQKSWHSSTTFEELRRQNVGKWWAPGEEFNQEFTDFMEQPEMRKWVGCGQGAGLNLLVVDRHNIMCNEEDSTLFEIFDRFDIEPHVVEFRNRYFWDVGLSNTVSVIERQI